jgi:hypothetical protein
MANWSTPDNAANRLRLTTRDGCLEGTSEETSVGDTRVFSRDHMGPLCAGQASRLSAELQVMTSCLGIVKRAVRVW